jgi:hypothetical protein
LPFITSTSIRESGGKFSSKAIATHSRLALGDANICALSPRSKVTELQQEHSEYLAQKKAEALDAVALMEDYVARKVEQERSSDRESGQSIEAKS